MDLSSGNVPGEKKLKKKQRQAARAACVEAPTKARPVVPATTTIVVVVVLLLTSTLAVQGMPTETVVTTVGIGGFLGIELVRRLVEVRASYRAA